MQKCQNLLIQLGKKKNYEVVASSHCNLFFVDKSYFEFILKESISIDDKIDDLIKLKILFFVVMTEVFRTTKPLRLGWHKININNEITTCFIIRRF